MDGVHDMGGAPGFGPVVQEDNEPLFHGGWEARVMAMTVAMGRPGGWNIDMSRSARENRPREDYLAKSYYEIWLAGLERLMLERGMIATDEIAAGHALHPPKPNGARLAPDDVPPMLRRGSPSHRPETTPARFKIGDRVRARMISPPTHTRLPHYVRGHIGTVELVHGSHVFPDTNALGAGEQPQWLYTVSFDGRDLWGEQANANTSVSVDAWESYLETA
ncbi:nitrile hydratase subunit beta [Bradyrhizobium sp. 2TAF24]|uniref:nitrile hydratase subunit beta n=1 Tax=Bradyrhizobium sp. 2TAF24 TaxID=3233011 RepID=UPI003F91E509